MADAQIERDQRQRLAMIVEYGRRLTRRQLDVLRCMRDGAETCDEESDYGELVYERGRGFVGLDAVSGRTVFALLRACAISPEDFGGSVERYRINETGRALLARANVR